MPRTPREAVLESENAAHALPGNQKRSEGVLQPPETVHKYQTAFFLLFSLPGPSFPLLPVCLLLPSLQDKSRHKMVIHHMCTLQHITFFLEEHHYGTLQRPAARLMILSFFIWYSLGPPAAGREGGRKSRGTPPHPRPWDCVPRHPLLCFSTNLFDVI